MRRRRKCRYRSRGRARGLGHGGRQRPRAGLKPALAAVDRGATVALANKECLVCAGISSCSAREGRGPASCRATQNIMRCFRRSARETGKNWCALSSPHRADVPDMGCRRYRAGDAGAGLETSELEHGQKDHHRFRIDDEQGLEVIEASYLFALAPDEIDVLVHRSRSSTAWSNFGSFSGRATGAPDYAHADRALPRMARSHRRSSGQT